MMSNPILDLVVNALLCAVVSIFAAGTTAFVIWYLAIHPTYTVEECAIECQKYMADFLDIPQVPQEDVELIYEP